MKNANSLAKEANKLAKSDPEKAKKKFDEAIDAYEQVKKNVHTEVKDDTVFNWLFKAPLDIAFQAVSDEHLDSVKDGFKNNSRDKVIAVLNSIIGILKMKKAKL